MKKYLQLFIATVLLISILPAKSSAQTIVLGTGAAISVFSPLNRTNDYCVYEVIYFKNQINLAGVINAFAFQRHDGSNVDSIENVNIYMKHTNFAQLTAGNFDTSGYTLVFSGTFPNDSGAGWREVMLNGMFTYNNTDNLQVLVEKGYQPAIPNTPVTPRWIYTNTGTPTVARRYYGSVPISSATQLSTTNFTSNARLDFGTTGIVEINPIQFNVFPNPSSGNINFNHNIISEEVNLIIFNVSGEQVLNQRIENETMLSLEKLSPGIYFYSVTSSELKSDLKGKFIIAR